MVDHSAVPSRGGSKRGMELLRTGVCLALAMQLVMSPYAAARAAEEKPKGEAAPSATAASDVVLKTMQTELSRATAGLAKSDPAPYFLSYTVYNQNVGILGGADGSLLTDRGGSGGAAEVRMGVG